MAIDCWNKLLRERCHISILGDTQNQTGQLWATVGNSFLSRVGGLDRSCLQVVTTLQFYAYKLVVSVKMRHCKCVRRNHMQRFGSIGHTGPGSSLFWAYCGHLCINSTSTNFTWYTAANDFNRREDPYITSSFLDRVLTLIMQLRLYDDLFYLREIYLKADLPLGFLSV